MAEELGVTEVIVPLLPGVASAVGLIGADMRHEARRAFFSQLSTVTPVQLMQVFTELTEQVRTTVEGAGLLEDQIVITGSSDMRYMGQAYELAVEWPTLVPKESTLIGMAARFHEEHTRHYSYDIPDRDIELVSLRVTATATIDRPSDAQLETSQTAPKPKSYRRVHFRAVASLDCAVYERSGLCADDRLEGPAVIEQKDSTTLVPPDWSLVVAPMGHLMLNYNK